MPNFVINMPSFIMQPLSSRKRKKC